MVLEGDHVIECEGDHATTILFDGEREVTFEGEHATAIHSEGEPTALGWRIGTATLSVIRYDNGTVVFASGRDEQPTRLYELSADDKAAIRELLS